MSFAVAERVGRSTLRHVEYVGSLTTQLWSAVRSLGRTLPLLGNRDRWQTAINQMLAVGVRQLNPDYNRSLQVPSTLFWPAHSARCFLFQSEPGLSKIHPCGASIAVGLNSLLPLAFYLLMVERKMERSGYVAEANRGGDKPLH